MPNRGEKENIQTTKEDLTNCTISTAMWGYLLPNTRLLRASGFTTNRRRRSPAKIVPVPTTTPELRSRALRTYSVKHP